MAPGGKPSPRCRRSGPRPPILVFFFSLLFKILQSPLSSSPRSATPSTAPASPSFSVSLPLFPSHAGRVLRKVLPLSLAVSAACPHPLSLPNSLSLPRSSARSSAPVPFSFSVTLPVSRPLATTSHPCASASLFLCCREGKRCVRTHTLTHARTVGEC